MVYQLIGVPICCFAIFCGMFAMRYRNSYDWRKRQAVRNLVPYHIVAFIAGWILYFLWKMNAGA